jgi:hypothetical protein
MGLLLPLYGARALVDQILGTVLLLLGEFELRLGLVDLRLGLINLLMLTVDLRLDVADVGLRHSDLRLRLRLRLIDRVAIVAVVDKREQIARLDVLVVRDRNLSDIAADLRRDRKAARGDERIVSGLVVPHGKPIGDAADHRDQQQTRPDSLQDRMIAKLVAERSGWLPARVLLPFAHPMVVWRWQLFGAMRGQRRLLS